MHRIVPARVHGFLDHYQIAMFVLAPTLFGFQGTAAAISYAIAGLHFLLTIFTDYRMGLHAAIPLKVHGLVEAAMAPILMVMPFIAGFGDVRPAKIFFMGAGIAVGIIWLLSSYVRRTPPRQLLGGEP